MVQPQVASGVAELPPKMRVLVPEERRLCSGKGRKMSKPPSRHHLKYEFIFKLGRRRSTIRTWSTLNRLMSLVDIHRFANAAVFILFYFISIYVSLI